MVIVPYPVDESIEKELAKYQDQFNDLKAEASELRKNGRDTFFVETKMLEFGSLVKISRVTYDPVDVKKIQMLLADLRHELDTVKEGEPIEQALKLISDCTLDIHYGEFPRARTAYNTITVIYRLLPKEEKNLIIEACNYIREKLIHAE